MMSAKCQKRTSHRSYFRCDPSNGVSAVVGLALEEIRKDMVMNIDRDLHVTPAC